MESGGLMGMGLPFGVIRTFWNKIEVMVIKHCERAECHRSVGFKIVNFRLRGFYLDK